MSTALQPGDIFFDAAWDVRMTDTSLRDGSHHKRHQFTEDDVRNIVAALDESGVPVIEVTHGDGLGGSSFNYGFGRHTDAELVEIFESMVTKSDYDLGEGALDAFKFDLSMQVRDATFGNGRYCRNLLEAAIGHQAWRLRNEATPTVQQLRTLTVEDVLGDAVLAPGDELAKAGNTAGRELAGTQPAGDGSGQDERLDGPTDQEAKP